MQNYSRQSKSLLHKFFSHSLQQYGRRNKYLMTGWVSFCRLQRKEPCMSNCENLLSVPSKVINRQISETVDQWLRQELAGFWKGERCMDQIFTLTTQRQTVHWMVEAVVHQLRGFWEGLWQHPLQVSGTYSGHMEFHDIVSVIKSFCNNFQCRVGNSESSFSVKSGCRQALKIWISPMT